MPIVVAPRQFVDVWANPPNLPEFQRGKVWDDYQKFELVMSTFLGYPVGSFSIHVDSENKEWLLDGQQRLDTIQNMFIPTNVYNWATKPDALAISSTSPFHSLGEAKKIEHLQVTLSYLGYRWIRKIYDDTDKIIEETVAKIKGGSAEKKEERFHKRAELRKIEVEIVEEQLHLFRKWEKDNIPQQPMSVNFLSLSGLFLGLGRVKKIPGKEYWQSELENLLFGGIPEESAFYRRDLFFDGEDNYNSLDIGKILLELAVEFNDVRKEEFSAKLLNFGLIRPWLKDTEKAAYVTYLDDNNYAKASDIIEGLKNLNQYFSVIQTHTIGQLAFKEDVGRRITFEDQMKVFELINEAGTPLTEIELLVVRPAWRKKVDISGHAKLMRMVELCQDSLALKGPNNKDLDMTRIAIWQIAACYSEGFKKSFSERGLDRILG